MASACCRSSVSSGPSTAFSAAPEASARRTRSTARRAATGSGRALLAVARRAWNARPAPSAWMPPSGGRSIAIGTRGGSPPMSTRRVELVHGGSGTPDASRASTSSGSGNSSGRSSCSSRKKPCASSSSGVALSSSTWRPSAAIGATARYSGSPGCPRRRRSRCASSTTSRSMPAATACPVSSGRSTSVSSATTARRWTSNGLKPAPKSRATSARRGASSSVNTWWYLRHSSPSHCTVSVSGATTRQRSIVRVCSSRFMISAASMVLPSPTSSASSQRTGIRAVARSATWS